MAHLADLARIDLTEAELDHLAPQLSVILESVASIQGGGVGRFLRSGVDALDILVPGSDQVLGVEGQNIREWTLQGGAAASTAKKNARRPPYPARGGLRPQR